MLATLTCVVPAPTVAQTPPTLDSVCRAQDAALSDAAALSAANAAETQLTDASAASADTALAALRAAIGTGGDASPATLARFCDAAGEAVRLSATGSHEQARALFLGAYAFAARVQARDVGALAAYRLSLLSLSQRGDESGSRRAMVSRGAARAPAAPPALPTGCEAFGDNRLLILTALRCAAEDAAAAGDRRLAGKAQLRLSRTLLTLAGRRPEDAGTLRNSAAFAATQGLVQAEGLTGDPASLTLTAALLDAGFDAGLGRALGRSVDRLLAASIDAAPGLRARALALRGRLAEQAGDRISAAAWYRRAIASEARAPVPLGMPGWYLALARVEPASREAHVRAAFRALNAVRPVLPRVDPVTDEASFALEVRPVFEALVDVLLAKAPANADLASIGEVQEVVEEYRQAEIQSVLGRDCVPQTEPLRVAELRKGELLLYPILLADRVEIIYAAGSDDGTAHYRRLPTQPGIGKAAVAAMVGDMVRSIAYDGDTAWEAPSRRLYDLLIAPIQPMLGPETVLVIIPGQELGSLPFAALRDPEGHFLVERARLAVVPALAYATPGRARAAAPPVVLAAALGKPVELPGGSFPALAGTLDEARSAVEPDGRMRGNILLENFTRRQLAAALQGRRVDILHLATHAAFNGGSDRAFIVADGEAIPITDLRAMIGRSATRGDQLDLLILSACETAVGDDDQNLGLAGAAVQAGASSAIASLWEVSDEGTAELMKSFYRHYREGEGKGMALRAAQLDLIGRGGDFADPIVWASFTLLGGWR